MSELNLATTFQIAGINVQHFQPVVDTIVNWTRYHWVQVDGFEQAPRLLAAVERFKQALPQTFVEAPTTTPGITIKVDEDLAEQGYRIILAPAGIHISASREVGAAYALITLQQMILLQRPVPYGEIIDAPAVNLREVSVDCGRKYYSLHWFLQLIDQMTAAKVNSLVLHFSDKNGFMIESLVAPEVVSAEYLTQAEVKQLLAYAKARYIAVTPELDMPGHLGQVLTQHPEFRLGIQGEALRNDGNYLDVTNPKAVEFMQALVKEYAELFDHSSPYFSLGGDEYLPDDFTKAGLQHYPALGHYAARYFGEAASGVEAFYDFLNAMGQFVQDLGYQPQLFHDRILRRDATSKVALADDFVVKYWTHCRTNMPTLETVLHAGYSVINYDDNDLYYVLGENAGYLYPQADKIYQQWHNGKFSVIVHDQLGNPENLPQGFAAGECPAALLGSAISIWSDNYTAQTETEVMAGFVKPLWAFAQKAWGAHSEIDYETFQSVASKFW